jgi:N-6 DNA Methylase
MQSLRETLSQFDMTEKEGGLVFVKEARDDSKDMPLSELLAIHKAQEFKANAVYFRRFENQSSIPQAYIYDETKQLNTDWAEVHTRLWSSGIVPMFIVVTVKSEIKIFNCTNPVTINPETKEPKTEPIDIIVATANIINDYEKRFSGIYLDNGALWELPRFKNVFNSDKSPFKLLLDYLKDLRKEVLNNPSRSIQVSEYTINKLLVMCILVKYLEEKKNDNTKLFEIDRDFLKGYNKFTDILRAKGKCLEFFDSLAQKFNGRVFEWNKQEEAEINSRKELVETDWTLLADYLDGIVDVKKKQYFLWEQYSFNDLPVELISGIYEALLPDREGVVYTPPHLVYFLIDQCMPLNNYDCFVERSFKILDPSCGSGVFLVGAYRRMIQWYMLNEYKKTGILKEPDLDTHIDILKNNVYGVDIERDATRIAIFSLVIALCDNLTPLTIWHKLKLPDLNKDNIATKDFFQFFHETDRNFDLVIGNPPFNPPTKKDKTKYEKAEYLKWVKTEYQVTPSAKIPSDNIAIFFLDRAIRLCKDTKNICLILPSSLWLYSNNSHKYRKEFSELYNVQKVFDFTHLRNVLFHGSASISVCAVLAELKYPTKKDVEHIIIQRTATAEERIIFEIDHYNKSSVPFELIEDEQIWKANLLGGGRLFKVIQGLKQHSTFQNFIQNKEEKFSWVVAQGYATKPKPNLSEEQLFELGYKKANHITDKKTIITESLDENMVPDFFTETEIYFQRNREKKKKIFEPPHLLIRQNLGQTKIPTYFSNEYLCFREKIIGIHAPNDKESLLRIQKVFEENADIYRFQLIATSPQIGITRPGNVLLKTDIENLPFSEDGEPLKLSVSEKILVNDTLKYMNTLGNASSNSELQELLDVTKNENELLEYGETFCKILNPVYRKENMAWQIGEIIETPTYFCYGFWYGLSLTSIKKSHKQDIDVSLKKLIEENTHKSVKTTRILRGYFNQEGYDKLYLIKPKQRRYWLQSIAIWDADETFDDLIKAGY